MNSQQTVGRRSSSYSGQYHARKANNGLLRGNFNYVMLVIGAMTVLIVFGVVFSATNAPHESGGGGPATNSILQQPNSNEMRTMSQKIYDWIPGKHGQHAVAAEEAETFPDWSQEFWSPIDVDVQSDPLITLCKLNFKTYSESPHTYPMFRDLEGMSGCRGNNKRREKLSVLMKEIEDQKDTPGGRVIKPSGFVFHESRVGSTLVANTLASDPWSIVFSESAPAANALLHCRTCDHERQVKLFRDVVTLMGRSPFHKRLFFKFQSITSTKMQIALEAFPDTPWAFVYRQPVQTMMSHLDPLKGSTGAPCLRSMRDPPDEVQRYINLAMEEQKERAGKEAWCAAHLNMLCNSALRAYEKFGVVTNADGSTHQRGILINYESLPGGVARVLLPLFNVVPTTTWLSKMLYTSTHYSKGRSTKAKPFLGDSEDKDKRATNDIQKYAGLILQPSYEKLVARNMEALKAINPDEYARVLAITDAPEEPVKTTGSTNNNINNNAVGYKPADGIAVSAADVNWKALKEVPLLPVTSRALATGGADTAAAVSGDPAAAAFVVSRSGAAAGGAGGARGSDRAAILAGKHSAFDNIQEYAPWAPFANTHSSKPYETVDCPLHPPKNYPITYNMLKILENWNSDTTEIPAFHYDSLCHFDYQNQTQLQQSYSYRDAEVPFVTYNVPEVDQVVKKWSNVDYLHKKLGKKSYRTETSKSNHFMYWHGGGSKNLRGKDGKKWEPPTSVITSTFEDWLELAVKGQNKSLDSRTHQYFRVSSDMGNSWLFDELPFFKPKKNLFMVEPREQRGIHCRFGMRNVIAEAHFDGSRNSIAMIGGLRRWILTHPDQCENMHMLPKNHPSGRHSEVDWSKPNVELFPNFKKVVGNEIILQPGDVLYAPIYWIHYIVSLNVNVQCNTRSGRSKNFDSAIKKCGF